MSEIVKNRYDFSILLEIENGTPNGDPAMDNRPRIDIGTGKGIISDASVKRKIRDYVLNYGAINGYTDGYNIYVRSGTPLEVNNNLAFEVLDIDSKVAKKNPDSATKIRDFMCKNFYDIRTFGAVMTTFATLKLNCGQVMGAVQFDFGKSIEPIEIEKITVTRVTVATEAEAKEGKKNMIGSKYIVPYALYRINGYVTPRLAKITGFSEEDLALLWQAITNSYDLRHSASSGRQAVRKLVVFKHYSELGNAPSYELFDRLKVKRKENVDVARQYEDYAVTLDTDNLPAGIEVINFR